MGFVENIKKTVEWVEHGRTIVEIVLALGGGTLLKAALIQFTRLPSIWITPIWMLSSGLILLILIKIWPRDNTTNPATNQIVASAIKPPVPSLINPSEFFRTSYTGQVQTEVEMNVRAMVQGQPQQEREEFCVRFIATGIINTFYYQVWILIFQSQILALEELNTKVLRREDLKPYYDTAVPANPNFYSGYSFEQWLEFLKAHGLIIFHPGNTVEITVRGKDFLKYMLHYGYKAKDRKN
jgi:hypothetical protein